MDGDARIPVLIRGVQPAEIDPLTVLLLGMPRAGEGPDRSGWAAVRQLSVVAPAPHAAGCACCARPPGGLALTLSELFAQRAKGTVPLFRRVLLLLPAWLAPQAAHLLLDDPLLASRYRLDGTRGENVVTSKAARAMAER